jgi:hypothetical protein
MLVVSVIAGHDAGFARTVMTTTSTLKDVDNHEFSTETTYEGSAITVRMVGNWDLKAVASLDAFTRALQKTTESVQATRVIVNLKAIEFMNSSCLKSFAWWVGTLAAAGDRRNYSITFQIGHTWQRRSLEAVKNLAPLSVFIMG